jgi:hypothetical protein
VKYYEAAGQETWTVVSDQPLTTAEGHNSMHRFADITPRILELLLINNFSRTNILEEWWIFSLVGECRGGRKDVVFVSVE